MHSHNGMVEAVQCLLEIEDVKWAANSAVSSIEKWSEREGYYNNRLASHLMGKLGELAVEKYLLENGYQIDSHFRFSDRENLCDIVVKVKKYTQVCRLEVKTWSANYWAGLGRCISVEQYPILKKKADLVLWCVVETSNVEGLLNKPERVKVLLAGWSRVQETSAAAVKDTGTGGMRKVRNYQLGENDLHPVSKLTSEGLSI